MSKFFTGEGPPGTGKTSLARTIFKQAVDKGYTVCYETFRRNMADDFISRLSDIDKSYLGWVTTTHGICFRLLASEFNYTRDDVATAKDWKEFCRKIGIPVDPTEINKLSGEGGDTITHINELKSLGAKIYAIYSNCTNMLIDIDKWTHLPSNMQPIIPPPYDSMIPTIIDKWISYLEAKNMIDFPQMLQKTLELKLSPPVDIYIADEFQDKTPIQFELFMLWSKDKESVVVLFDKNQAIYSFWGTNPAFCDEVRRRSKFKVLTPSWRLSQEVYEKACYLLKSSGQEVFNIKCVGSTTIHEIDFSRLGDIINKYKDIMILARTNYHLLSVVKILTELGVPFIGRFGWSDKQLRIYSFVWKYRNKVEPIYRSELMEFLKSTKVYPSATLKFIERSLKPELTLQDVNNYLSAEHRIILSSDNPFLYTNLSDKGTEKLTRAFLYNRPPRYDIFLTTIHGAKGLEADTVVVFDGITNKIMYSMYSNSEEMRNEYRVWYVALTRARKHCFIIRNAPIGFSIPFLPSLEVGS